MKPSHAPTKEQRTMVETMAAVGVPSSDIARVVGVDAKTLRKHYRDELDLGMVKANAKVAGSLFKKATGDGPQSVTAAIFWAKTRMGWRETVVNEHTGPKGGPILTADLTKATDDQLAALEALLGPLAAASGDPAEAGSA